MGFQSLPTATALNNPGLGPDILYVGDENDNTVKSFNADTGASLDGAAGAFVTSGSGGLNGPTGLLIAGPELIVVNQNFGGANGEILQYQLKDGSFTGPWVSQSDPNAPFAPRGAVLKNGVLYVSNFVEDDAGTAGEVLVFAGSGELLGKLTPSGGLRKKFRPRGVVIGPDGLLYVSSDPNFEAGPGPTTGGQVLRFDPNTLAFKDVFIDDSGGVGQLNRPEGLVFDPDGKKLGRQEASGGFFQGGQRSGDGGQLRSRSHAIPRDPAAGHVRHLRGHRGTLGELVAARSRRCDRNPGG